MSDLGEPLDALDHDALVALLNRLYAEAGESGLRASTVGALSDDELRAAIRTVQGRLADRAAPDAPPLVRNLPPARPGKTNTTERPRFLCVVFTSNRELLSETRKLLRARSIPTVAVDSAAALVALLGQAMPTHIVIDASCGRLADVMAALGPRTRDLSIVQGSTEAAVLAAVAGIAEL